jgi:hypothetical protein
MKKKIYLASSWRNAHQPSVLVTLREAGHEVYDFRNPGKDDKGFGWDAIDPNWRTWTPKQLRDALQHPLAIKGHDNDHTAMEWANVGVLLLPSGNSAHLEAGWIAGRGKPTFVYAPEIKDPDLMYKSFERVGAALGYPTFCLDLPELLESIENSAVVL